MSLVGAALIWNDPKGAGIDQEWWLGKCGEGFPQLLNWVSGCQCL